MAKQKFPQAAWLDDDTSAGLGELRMIWTHGMVHLVIDEDRHGKRTLSNYYYMGERETFESAHSEIIEPLCARYGWDRKRVPDEVIGRILHTYYHDYWPYTTLPKWGWPLVKREDLWILLHRSEKRKARFTEEILKTICRLPTIGYEYSNGGRCYVDLREVVKLLLPKPKPPRCVHCNRMISAKRQVRESRWLWKNGDRLSRKYLRQVENYDRKVMCGPFCAEKARREILAVNQLVRTLESRQRIHERRIQKWNSIKRSMTEV